MKHFDFFAERVQAWKPPLPDFYATGIGIGHAIYALCFSDYTANV